MDAAPALREIARTLNECGLEAVLIGNAAAALQGAPVTTLDFDFMFRKNAANMKKLKALARSLGGYILSPYYPLSGLYRVMVDDRGLQLDFMSIIHGIRSYEGLKSRASRVYFGDCPILVADLRDIIRSKRALGRPKDMAILEILEQTLDEKEKS